MPPLRQLAEQYDLSLSVVNQTLQEFAGEGLLYMVPRVGTFIGQRHVQSEFYVLLMPYHPEDREKQARMQLGFEERITQLGAATLVMQPEQALDHRSRGELPHLAGVFNYAFDPAGDCNWHWDGGVPHVGFASWTEDVEHYDLVSFDDVDGGRQATQYLLSQGHRRIAYLGFHTVTGNPLGLHRWSIEREDGWRQALEAAGQPTAGLTYHLNQPLSIRAKVHEQRVVAEAAARPLCSRPDITAVVAANDRLAIGLFGALRAHKTPVERWPSVVGFDNSAAARTHQMTSLDLPWNDLGRAAADLLWERGHGRLCGPPQHRRIPMRLIRRMTSQTGWSALVPAVTTGVSFMHPASEEVSTAS